MPPSLAALRLPAWLKLVKSVKLAARNSGDQLCSLPACLPHLNAAHVLQAKLLCRRISPEIKAAKEHGFVALSAQEVEELVFVGVCAGDHHQVNEVAQMVYQDPMSLRFRSKTLYLLLLELAASKNDHNTAVMALDLFEKLHLHCPQMSPEEWALATTLLYQCYRHCRDFTQLLVLKLLYENIIVHNLAGFKYEALFIGAHLHVLINSFQYVQVLELMRHSFQSFPESHHQQVLLQSLPISKFFNLLLSYEDCDSLSDWIPVVVTRIPSMVSLEDWAKFLSLAVSKNHFRLTKLVYTHAIMDGIELLSIDDVLTTNVVADLESKSPMLATLSDHTLQAVLRTLASHGDVQLTLNLIEWHYVHRLMQGERGLTKELCIEIVRSYCFHQEKSSVRNPDGDSSMERVLDVLESFIQRLQEQFSYIDISDAMSFKFNTLNLFDDNVATAMLKEKAAAEFLTAANEASDSTLRARKLTNNNIIPSLQGHVLMNKKLLHQVVLQHLNYMRSKNMSLECIRIYTECIMNHINKYQNMSGIVSTMMAIKSLNYTLAEWCTPSVLNIAIKSVSGSPAARLTGSILYSFAKQNDIVVTKINLEHLIYSSLRGTEFNHLLEYYVHEYLSLDSEKIDPQVLQRIREFSHLNDEGRRLVSFLEDNTTTTALERWDSHGFTSNLPSSESLTQGYSKDYYRQIDLRDAQYLSYVLCISDHEVIPDI